MEAEISQPLHADAVAEVDARLAEAAAAMPPETAAARAAYLGGAGPHLGLIMPVQHQLFRQGYSFSGLAPEDQLPVWDAVWHHGRFHESKHQALFYADRLAGRRALAALAWAGTRGWAAGADAWDLSDALSSVHTRLLARMPETVHPELVRWNRDLNPWLRRQSIVGLLYSGGPRRPDLQADQILPLVEALLADPHPYVQKAVGWTLREASVAHAAETLAFLRRHAAAPSAIALPAAIAKLPEAERAAIKALRAEQRRRTVATRS